MNLFKQPLPLIACLLTAVGSVEGITCVGAEASRLTRIARETMNECDKGWCITLPYGCAGIVFCDDAAEFARRMTDERARPCRSHDAEELARHHDALDALEKRGQM